MVIFILVAECSLAPNFENNFSSLFTRPRDYFPLNALVRSRLETVTVRSASRFPSLLLLCSFGVELGTKKRDAKYK